MAEKLVGLVNQATVRESIMGIAGCGLRSETIAVDPGSSSHGRTNGEFAEC
jgi:hypothetical protein